jgi:hypothetical protein
MTRINDSDIDKKIADIRKKYSEYAEDLKIPTR